MGKRVIVMNVFEDNRNLFYKIAQENTVKNKFGETTISRQDESFEDDIWEQAYKEYINNPINPPKSCSK